MGGYWSSKKDPEENSEKKKKKRKRGAEPDGHEGKRLLVANPYVLKRTGYVAVEFLEGIAYCCRVIGDMIYHSSCHVVCSIIATLVSDNFRSGLIPVFGSTKDPNWDHVGYTHTHTQLHVL